MGITVKSWGETSLQTASWKAFLANADDPFARVADPILARPAEKHPRAVGNQPKEANLVLHIRLLGGPFQDLLDQLGKVFPKGMKDLVTVDFGDTATPDERVVEAQVTRVIPNHRVANRFTVVLTAPDPRWRSADELVVTGAIVALQGGVTTDQTREDLVEGDGRLIDGSIGLYRGTTNDCTNGGAESGTAGWVPTGANTIAAVPDPDGDPIFGAQVFELTYQNNTLMVSLPITVADNPNTISGRIKLPQDWDGGDVSLSYTGFVGSFIVEVPNAISATDVGRWIDVFGITAMAIGAGQTGFLLLSTTAAPTAGRKVLFEAVQSELWDYPTPYVETDGATASRALSYLQVSGQRIDEVQGWAFFRFRAAWGVNDLLSRSIFKWGSTADRLALTWNSTLRQWEFDRYLGASPAGIMVAGNVEYGAIKSIAIKWSATQLGLSIDGGAFTTASNAGLPDLSAFDALIGNDDDNGHYGDFDLFRVQFGSGDLTDAQVLAMSLTPSEPNVLRASGDFTREVWKKSGVTVTKRDRVVAGVPYTRLDFAGGSNTVEFLSQVFDSNRSALPFTSSLQAFAEKRVELEVRVSDHLDSEGAVKTIVISTKPQRYEVTHSFAGSGKSTKWALENKNPRPVSVWIAEPQLEQALAASSYSATLATGPALVPGPGVGVLGLGSSTMIGGSVQPPGDGGPPGDGQVTLAVQNAGNAVEDAAVIEVRPLVNKDKAKYWTIGHDIILASRALRGLSRYAVEIMGTFSHENRVLALQAMANGNDWRVFVDEVEVPRWPGDTTATDWNQDTTDVWLNLTLAAGKQVVLQEAIATLTSSEGDEIKVKSGSTVGWPDEGYLVNVNAGRPELFHYVGTTKDSFLLGKNGGRAQRSTTAFATHAVGDELYWVEKRVRIVYGYLSAPAPDAVDELKPMIRLGDSTNEVHKWSSPAAQANGQGFRSDDPRSMQWSRILQTGGPFADAIFADTANDRLELIPEDTPSGSATRIRANAWRRRFPVSIDAATDAIDFGLLDVAGGFLMRFLGASGVGEDVELEAVEGVDVDDVNETDQMVHPTNPFPHTPVTKLNDLRVVGEVPLRLRSPTGLIDDTETVPSGSTITQRFTMPGADGRGVALRKVYVQLRRDDTQGLDQTVVCKLSIDDGTDTDTRIDIATVTRADIPSETEGPLPPGDKVTNWMGFDFAGLEVVAGEQYFIELEHTVGTTLIEWIGWKQPFEGGTQARTLAISGEEMATGSTVKAALVATGQVYAHVDDISVTLDSGEAPFVLSTTGVGVYVLDAAIHNTRTEQTVFVHNAILEAATSGFNTLVLDVVNRTAYELGEDLEPTGRRFDHALEFSDDPRVLDILPGNNDISYLEEDLVDVDLTIRSRSVWQ